MTGLAGLLSNRYHQDDIPDQTGRTAIVTGGTSGIGRQIAKGLAVAGARG
jgi:NADP-dependent 3-hydroxy acid dehydrogenase YdfG